jgi:hypothetical protein
MTQHLNLAEAEKILAALGLPKAQQNTRSAICLLALLNITPEKAWKDAEPVLIGITPMMTFAAQHYGLTYAPNTRETFRRFTMHQFVDAGLALYNPDQPERPVNSPKTVYQIEDHALELLRTYGTDEWDNKLRDYFEIQKPLAQRYASEREMRKVPVRINSETRIALSAGEHSNLIKAIIEEFAPRFTPDSRLIYVGDTGDKWGYFDQQLLNELGITVDSHGKMPDAVLYFQEKRWLILVEAVTSHGPVDAKRRAELTNLFRAPEIGIVYVTAFPNKSVLSRYLTEIAWETEVWIAENPSHLIHFNGERFLGPYESR